MDVASHWLLGEDQRKLEDVYKKVDNIPESLLVLEDPLPKAVLATYQARKNFLSSGSNTSRKKLLKQCEIASQLLADCLTYSSYRARHNLILVSCFILG